MKNIGLTVDVTNNGVATVKLRGGGTANVTKGKPLTDPQALSVRSSQNGTQYTLLLDGKPLAQVSDNGGQTRLQITGSPAAGKVIQSSISKKGNKYRIKAVRVPVNAANQPPLCGGIIVV